MGTAGILPGVVMASLLGYRARSRNSLLLETENRFTGSVRTQVVSGAFSDSSVRFC